MNVKRKTNSKLYIAEPYYEQDGGSITGINDIYEKMTCLRLEIEQIANALKLSDAEKRRLKYGIYFRGQADYSKKLLPKIGRPNNKFTSTQEKNMIHRFRRRCYFQHNRILTDWETIFLARHFGLPTRLLDWTAGLYKGLYWACEEEFKKDGAVWAMIQQPGAEDYYLNVFDCPLLNEYKYAKDCEFLIKGVKFIYPFYVHPRMAAQASSFTIQDNPYVPLEEYKPAEHEREDFDILHIRRWRVPKEIKKKILCYLEDVGVNMQTLFPDLEGIAKGTELTEIMRSQGKK